MAGQILSALSALLRPNVESKTHDLLFREADFVNLLRENGGFKDGGSGGAPYKWNVITSGNSSVETFVEGQAPPPAGRQTPVQASVDVFGVRGVIGETGHVRDNRERAAFYEDPMDLEQMLLEADLFKKLDDELCGSTQDRGIASIIDSTGTYAGLSQGTYSVWASEENGTIGTLGIDDLQDLYEELVSPTGGSSVPRGAKPTHVLMPANQITNYQNTIGPVAGSGSLFRFQGNTGFNGGLIRSGMAFQEMPVVQVRGITSTEVYMLDMTDIEVLIHRDIRVDPILGNPEMIQEQLSATFAVKVRRRNKHGKMTGVTA